MKISLEMKELFPSLDAILSSLPNTFTSHDFIKRFSHNNETLYIDFLNLYRGSGAFNKVNSQIGKFLSDNEDFLRINKTRKVMSENVFGEMDSIQEWIKI